MSETIGPSEEELGLSQGETDTVASPEPPKKIESYAELVQAVHGEFGDNGVRAMSVMHQDFSIPGRNARSETSGMADGLSDDELRSLVKFIDERGGNPNLNRLQWVLDNRNHFRDSKNPFSAPEFPGKSNREF